MRNQELPDYKRTFLAEMDQLRRQELEQLERTKMQQTDMSNTSQKHNRPEIQNNILNTSQYSSSDWRQQLNRTTTQCQHNPNQFDLSLMLNPEIAKKKHNIQSTQISEYSNAKHNNNVFVNPKNTSC